MEDRCDMLAEQAEHEAKVWRLVLKLERKICSFIVENFDCHDMATAYGLTGMLEKISHHIQFPYGERSYETPRKKLTQKLRIQVMERDKYKCQICKTHLSLSIDHVKPIAKNGTNDIGNLRTLCKPCNSSKRDRKAVL